MQSHYLKLAFLSFKSVFENTTVGIVFWVGFFFTMWIILPANSDNVLFTVKFVRMLILLEMKLDSEAGF